MKKFLLSIAVIIGFGAYALIQRGHSPTQNLQALTAPAATGSDPGLAAETPVSTPAPAPSGSAASAQTSASGNSGAGSAPPGTATPPATPPASPPPATPPATPPVPANSGQYKDGQYTGPSVDAFYGNIQVRATVSGGKLTGVQFLQYPNDRSTSLQINGQAMPLLSQEAVQAQSANVDGVSGATQTSDAFVQSLQAALNQAKNI